MQAKAILEYLEHQLPDYPFEPGVDTPFVEELVADFGDVHILDEIKMFRWYHDNKLTHQHPRAALRRWLTHARRTQRW